MEAQTSQGSIVCSKIQYFEEGENLPDILFNLKNNVLNVRLFDSYMGLMVLSLNLMLFLLHRLIFSRVSMVKV